MRRRRLSTNPVNVKRRLANRVAQAVAVVVLAGSYYVWNTYIAPVGDSTVVQPQPGAMAAMQTASAREPAAQVVATTPASGGGIEFNGKKNE